MSKLKVLSELDSLSRVTYFSTVVAMYQNVDAKGKKLLEQMHHGKEVDKIILSEVVDQETETIDKYLYSDHYCYQNGIYEFFRIYFKDLYIKLEQKNIDTNRYLTSAMKKRKTKAITEMLEGTYKVSYKDLCVACGISTKELSSFKKDLGKIGRL